MAELADATDLGSVSKEWGFKSLYPHHTPFLPVFGWKGGIFCFIGT